MFNQNRNFLAREGNVKSDKLTDKEKKISSAVIWLWRNLLASGVILICFAFLYDKCEQIEDSVIEVRTIVKERIRIERGDYGWSEAAHEPAELTDEMIEKGDKARQDIDNFVREKK